MNIPILIVMIVMAAMQMHAQSSCLTFKVVDALTGEPIVGARIAVMDTSTRRLGSDREGKVSICGASPSARLMVTMVGYDTLSMPFPRDGVDREDALKISLQPRRLSAEPITVMARRDDDGVQRLEDITAGAIYAAKKTERIELGSLAANTAANNPRQVFAGIPGLNIWESDGAGLQLGIGGRGLSPNRTSNFTTRQNGYDISADPLGYPESYYTPPMEMLDRIELVRGAGSLRYGTQFGGMVNFVMREGGRQPLSMRIRASGGSFGFLGLFAEVGGTIGDLRYIVMYKGNRADGWRPNSTFDVHTAYAALRYDVSNNLRLRADVTTMSYLAQQPGGMTDRQFDTDPTRSYRSRNWFGVDWNVFSVRADAILDDVTTLQAAAFATIASRKALGNLERITVADLGSERTLISGDFTNVGLEATVQRMIQLFDTNSTILGGVRLFRGSTVQQQGNASAGSDANFSYLRPGALEGSDFRFPNDNIALFSEAVVRIGAGWSLVPGLRFEHITTRSEGTFRQRVTDFAGNVIVDTSLADNRIRSRSFIIAGLGITRRLSESSEVYANISQNYRSITFSDLRIDNPNLRVDSSITDERGFNADLGIRGSVLDGQLTIDASLFYLRYADRIGQVLRADVPPLFLPYRFRANIADAFTTGVEAVVTANVSRMMSMNEHAPTITVMLNGSLLYGRYVNTDDASVRNRDVELVPPYTVRGGVTVDWYGFRCGLLVSAVGRHFTDATNAEFSATAVNGIIPDYLVADLTFRYAFDSFSLELSCNNALDARYFTRRADAYPGPGIIPSDPRTLTGTVEVRL